MLFLCYLARYKLLILQRFYLVEEPAFITINLILGNIATPCVLLILIRILTRFFYTMILKAARNSTRRNYIFVIEKTIHNWTNIDAANCFTTATWSFRNTCSLHSFQTFLISTGIIVDFLSFVRCRLFQQFMRRSGILFTFWTLSPAHRCPGRCLLYTLASSLHDALILNAPKAST